MVAAALSLNLGRIELFGLGGIAVIKWWILSKVAKVFLSTSDINWLAIR